MKSRFIAGILLLGLMVALPNLAQAQNYPNLSPGSAVINAPLASSFPLVNPYLNLTNPLNSQIPIYQSVVRPFVDTQQALSQQGAQIQQLNRAAAPGGRRTAYGGSASSLTTGHHTQFMNYSHYYVRRR